MKFLKVLAKNHYKEMVHGDHRARGGFFFKAWLGGIQMDLEHQAPSDVRHRHSFDLFEFSLKLEGEICW